MRATKRKGKHAGVPEPETISLAEIFPQAKPHAWAGAVSGEINEIPLDESPDDPALDLRLKARRAAGAAASAAARADVAAAQAVSLPRSAATAANTPGSPERRPERPGLVEASSPTARVRGPARRPPSEPAGSLPSEVANLPLFAELDPESLHALIARLRVVHLDQGQILFRQGDAADALYVVTEGAVVPIAEGAEGEGRRKLAVIERGDFVGEIGLITKQPRNATVAALVESRLVAIDRRVLVPLMKQAPSIAQALLRFLRARMLDRQIRSSLFFAAFAHAEREAVARQFRLLEVHDGTRVATRGAPPEGLFVVLAGSLARVDPDRGEELGRIELGDVFGGDWLLAGRPSPWDVVARGRCWLIVLGERRFRRIVDANPRLVRVLDRLARRAARPEAAREAGLSANSIARGQPRGAPRRVSRSAAPPPRSHPVPHPVPAPTSRRPSSSPRAGAEDRARRSRS